MSSYRNTIRQPGFQPFLWTQFLGAVNDNLFKIVVTLLAVGSAAAADEGRAVALVNALFILPFLLFSGYAGQLADGYSKRTILVITKCLEVGVMAVGMIALAAGHLEAAAVVVFLMALHSTFFSPAKYGILPETLPEAELSRANGLLEMSTFVAIVIGTAAGGFLFDQWRTRLWLIGLMALTLAVLGMLASFRIRRVLPAGSQQAFDWNPFGEIRDGIARLWSDRVLWPSVIGLSYFWFFGALLQQLALLFGTHTMGLDARWVGVLMTFAAVGIGTGSMAAGRLSGDKVELGLVPIGAFGMGVCSLLLAASGDSFIRASACLTLIGFSGGLFAVPLNAMLQQRPDAQEKGRLLATNSFLNMVGILLASGVLYVATDILKLSPERVFAVSGLVTIAGSVYVLARVPEFFVRFSLWLLTHTVYRIRIIGQQHVPSRGPALLVCNHMSHVDGFLVGACVQRFVRFLVYRPYFEKPAMHWFLSRIHAIPVAAGRDAVASLERARKELEGGHVVCIFAEGEISRTANLLPFRRGLERIAGGLDVPVIPVYIDRVWGSIFSYERGRFFWKWPRRIPYSVTVAFGAPLPASATAPEVRLAVMELGSDSAGERHGAHETLASTFIRTARRQWGAFCIADSSGLSLTFGRALVSSLLLGQWLRKNAPGDTVGLLLPASAGGALANVATALAGKIAVNLNFTAGAQNMSYAVERAGIRTILTSKRFLAKADIAEMPGMVMLEDVLPTFTTTAKLRMLLIARLLPVRALVLKYGRRSHSEKPAAIIFSSGSTGTPKGVQLTHRNVLANVHAVAQVFDMRRSDVMIGVLPLFHAFGYTGTLWFPLLTGFGTAFHPNPMDAKTIGDLTERYKGTILMSTPTFCQSYVRKCEPKQFAHIRYAVVGAEKLRPAIADAFREKFGVTLLEGYGCTEMAPVVAANVPDVQDGSIRQRGSRPGTVGHTLPGIAAKVVDPETFEGPLFNKEGLLLVKGPSRMLGYLGEPARTAEVIRENWYVTGDIAAMDEDGFIRITDRLSRFSKLGGEMVPHIKIEESLNALLTEPHTCVVTSAPDESRGERLVAFYTDPAVTPQRLWERLCETDMPRLWLPKREDMHYIEAIPALGTGKTDLRRVKQMASEIARV
ncbi:MAG TPA: acyl-[ACP]--phospholipid O-acyltransferase [Vicinamibacterales bacterium]|nr:acyl-[ACP]--phospholipid O-acyltransferase [Vicinamibacterales bacterium]